MQLTQEQINEIKDIYTDYTNKEIADMYGVKLHSIRKLSIKYNLTKYDGNYKEMLNFANDISPNKEYKRLAPAFDDYGMNNFMEMFKTYKRYKKTKKI